MIFYFSGTGNSKWIANQLSKEQKEELVFIPDALKDRTFEFCLREDEKIGFVFPVYSWAPPEIVLNFIRQLSLKGYKRQYLFFVCSCGDDTGLTQQVLEKALSHKGWKCHAGFSVTMPNNYVLLPGFDVDKKELEVHENSFVCTGVHIEPFRCLPGIFILRMLVLDVSVVRRVVR